MTPTENLELAEQLIQQAADYLLIAALGSTAECRTHAKAIAVRLRAEERNTYALRASIGGVNLTESLERALGGSVGEVCS